MFITVEPSLKQSLFWIWCSQLLFSKRISLYLQPLCLKRVRLHTGYWELKLNLSLFFLRAVFFVHDRNILLNYAASHPHSGYSQGMSDLLAPILAEMQQEADAFWCFTGLMTRTIFVSSPTDSDMDKQLVSLQAPLFCFFHPQPILTWITDWCIFVFCFLFFYPADIKDQ